LFTVLFVKWGLPYCGFIEISFSAFKKRNIDPGIPVPSGGRLEEAVAGGVGNDGAIVTPVANIIDAAKNLAPDFFECTLPPQTQIRNRVSLVDKIMRRLAVVWRCAIEIIGEVLAELLLIDFGINAAAVLVHHAGKK
jgi:hypothetical protein